MPTTFECPTCHAKSSTSDYCDSCGAPLPPSGGSRPPTDVGVAPAAAGPPTAGVDGVLSCDNCGADRAAADVFCEVCGLDFATGQMPDVTSAPPVSQSGAPSEWTVLIEADRAFFDGNLVDAADAGAVEFPDGLAPREVRLSGDEVVIGRRSESKGFFPGIDLASPVADPAVSHRHATLRRQADGSWALIDDMSTNGTWVNSAKDPVQHGVVTALHDGDFVHIGSFTRITVRHDGGPTS